jgi:hypothetical protein
MRSRLVCLTVALLTMLALDGAAARAEQPNRREFELLKRMPRPILMQFIPDEIGKPPRESEGCLYLIAAVVLGDKERAEDAWNGIEATFEQQTGDGGMKRAAEPGDIPFVVYETRVENMYGGRDSSYNAVSVLVGAHLMFYVPHPDLEAACEAAMDWERTRILPTGEIMVTGNTRTGVDREKNRAGKPKGVNYPDVVQTFWYYGIMHNVPVRHRPCG